MSFTVTPAKSERGSSAPATQETVIHTGSTVATDTSTVSPTSTVGSVPPTPSGIAIINSLADKIHGLGITGTHDVVQSPKIAPYTPPTARFRSGDGFVIHSSQNGVEDPFNSSSKKRDGLAQKNGHGFMNTTPSTRHSEVLASTNWRSGSSSGNSSESPTARKSTSKDSSMKTCASKDPGINSDRVSNRNAQAIYPPSACVFVANLYKGADEETLEYLVTKKFREYGTVWVKIRRDPRDMPFAFCQYTNDEDAERALKDGRGATILERPCRTEKAKANRTFYMSRINGHVIDNHEVRAAVAGIGPLSRTWKPSDTEKALYRLSEGIFIEFTYYEDGRDALIAFRDHNMFRIEQLNALEQTPIRRTVTNTSSIAFQYLQRYDIDRRSVFVGNLPQDITRGDLKEIFGVHGEIVEVEIISKESIIEGMGNNVFAFIEFASDASVQPAISSKHGFEVNGSYIKVYQKDSDGGNRRTGHDTSNRRLPIVQPRHARPLASASAASPTKQPKSLETLQSLAYNGANQPAIHYQASAGTMAYSPTPIYTYQYASTPYYVPYYYDNAAITSPYIAYNQALTTQSQLTAQPYTFTQSPPNDSRPYVPMTGGEMYYAPYSPAGCVPSATQVIAEDLSTTPIPQTCNAKKSADEATADH